MAKLRFRCTANCWIDVRNANGETEWTKREDLGQERRAKARRYTGPVEMPGDDEPTYQIYEFDTIDQLPRDMQPKPLLDAQGNRVLKPKPGKENDPTARYYPVPVVERDPYTGEVNKVYEDHGIAHFELVDAHDQPDPKRQHLLDLDYRMRHRIPYPAEFENQIDFDGPRPVLDEPMPREQEVALLQQRLGVMERAGAAKDQQISEMYQMLADLTAKINGQELAAVPADVDPPAPEDPEPEGSGPDEAAPPEPEKPKKKAAAAT